MDDLSGKQLGPYRIIAPLGEGGMAVVYRAFQPGVDRQVAIKVLPQHFAKDPQFAARFRQEAQVVARLQHPHILPVFDYGEAEGYTYIVMPIVTGGTLEDLLKGQPLPPAVIRRVIAQVGDALDYAHSRGLVHRDVKPSNILMDERGNCLLADFGLAKNVEGSERLTQSGMVMGTPVYMSPEQGRGRPLDRRTDVYALGVILYQMATGRPPYEADTPIGVVVMHITEPLPPPRSLRPDLPAPLETVIVRALAKRPDERYQTAGVMVESLNTALDSLGKSASQPVKTDPNRVAPTVPMPMPLAGGAPPPVTARRSWLPWAALAVGGGACVLLAAASIAAAILVPQWFATATPTQAVAEVTAAPLSTRETLPTSTEPIVTELAQTETPSPTATAPEPSAYLVEDDFEDGDLQNWRVEAGTLEVVTLPDGNRVGQLIMNEFNGAQIVYPPSFGGWPGADYAFEADVRLDSFTDNSSIQIEVRVNRSFTCLNYQGEFGAGHTALRRTTTASRTCDDVWIDEDLATLVERTYTAGEWVRLRLEVRGSTLLFYINDELTHRATDEMYAIGGIGLSAFEVETVYVDNLRAWVLEP